MNNEQRILELLAEVLHKVDALSGLKGDVAELKGDVLELKVDVIGLKEDVAELKSDVDGLKVDVAELKDDVKDLGKRMGRVEKDIVKLNVIGAENSRAIMKLADNSDRRLTRLEKAVFKF